MAQTAQALPRFSGADHVIERKPTSLYRDATLRLLRNKGAVIGLVVVTFFALVAIFAPLIAPHQPNDQNLALVGSGCCPGPSWGHLMGVDDLGRDEFSRVAYGTRYSLVIGVVSVAVGLSFGMLLGAIAGFVGGVVDSLIMRSMDVMLAIPGLLLAIGKPRCSAPVSGT